MGAGDPGGNNQTTPLVHDGVMFLASPGNVVQAIDALTGDVIWEYRSPLPEDAPQRGATRTLAFFGDKVLPGHPRCGARRARRADWH